jgi:hypothetical protein
LPAPKPSTRRSITASRCSAEEGIYLTFSPDGRWLAVNTAGGALWLFEAP